MKHFEKNEYPGSETRKLGQSMQMNVGKASG
uniref:Uncharacterized protein n=1 Tax=Arundo donax TaxID=35708 RepID=A0A0A9FZ88_ARUDO